MSILSISIIVYNNDNNIKNNNLRGRRLLQARLRPELAISHSV